MSSLQIDMVIDSQGTAVEDQIYVAQRRRHAVTTIPRDELIPPKRIRQLDDPRRRKPGWRMNLAVEFAKHSETVVDHDRCDDPLVMETLVPFQRALNGVMKRHQYSRSLSETYPGPYWAHMVRHDTIGDRFIVEAYICADASIEDIAAKLDVDPESVWWYEHMYFDVRRHLDNSTWMHTYVFHPAFQTMNCADGVWKAIAWKNALGVHGLEAIANIAEGGSPQADAWLSRTQQMKQVQDVVELFLGSKYTRFDRNNALMGYQSHLSYNLAAESHEALNPAEEHLATVFRAIPGQLSKLSAQEPVGVETNDRNAKLASLFEDRLAANQLKAREAQTVG